MVNCTSSCCSWQHKTQSSNRILTFCEPYRVIPGGSKDLNSIIYKQMHVKTLLMCKSYLMSTESTQKHTQTSNTNWWVLPLLIFFTNMLIHPTTVTTPSSHTLGHDTYCSVYSHKILTLLVHSSQTQSMQVFTQHWDWDTCLSVCSIHTFYQECDLFTFTEKHQTSL